MLITQHGPISYIMACSKSKMFNIVGAGVQNDDAAKAWTKLKMKFEFNQAKDLFNMIGDFNDLLAMEDKFEDLTIYIKALEEINKRFKSVDPKYKKYNMKMITFGFAKNPPQELCYTDCL